MFEEKKAPLVKMPYVSPVIQAYGNIRAITQTVGKNGASDGGTGNNKFTKA